MLMTRLMFLFFLLFIYRDSSEEVGHNFHGIRILLLHTIYDALFLLTQWFDLGCMGI